MRAATEHLLQRGYSHIAALGWPKNSRVGRERLEGYLAVLCDAGFTPRSKMNAQMQNHVALGHEATLRLLAQSSKERPTAIVAVSDTLAIGAMHAAQELGLRVGTALTVTALRLRPWFSISRPR